MVGGLLAPNRLSMSQVVVPDQWMGGTGQWLEQVRRKVNEF